MTHQRGLSRLRRGRGQIVLVPDGSESTLRQPISSVGHRHREDRPDTWSPSVPRQSLVVFTMPPHTTPLLILTHGDAVDPIPSAVQQASTLVNEMSVQAAIMSAEAYANGARITPTYLR